MVVGEGFNRAGEKRGEEKKIFIVGILWFLGVALAAREMRNSIVMRGCWQDSVCIARARNEE
ncbi:MAG TPA: hypothetical protein VIL86_07060 [Tepidisphaeraceae bacterium]|jgi:hypothetical protein